VRVLCLSSLDFNSFSADVDFGRHKGLSAIHGKLGNGKVGNGKLGNRKFRQPFFGGVGKVGNGKMGNGKLGNR